MKIVVIGNCQGIVLSNCLTLMAPGHKIERRLVTDDMRDLEAHDVILMQRGGGAKIAGHLEASGLTPPAAGNWDAPRPAHAPRLFFWPNVIFNGFHPDIVYLHPPVVSPIGNEHSAICLAAWKQGLSVDDTRSLFRRDVFAALGFFQYFDDARSWLAIQLHDLGFPGEQLVERWSASGCFMHEVVHPKIHVLADVANVLMEKIGIFPAIRNPEKLLLDRLQNGPIWPLYPPLSEALGLGPSEYLFKAGVGENAWLPPTVYDLDSFIRASFMRFEQASPESLQCARLDNGAYNDLRALVKIKIAEDRAQPVSPYTGLADYQFWRRAIERTPPEKVDPVVSGKFKITKAERIATAGSCFAQHISRTLGSSGFNYYIAESAPEEMSAEDGLSRNYGVFSARFGNIYTARQLVQLFDRAYGRFCPMDTEWMRTDGRWADPFRPTVEPDGFLSEADVERSREAHLSCVRSMFESLHVFIFTLGLTEGWRAKHDGAVFPLAPGVAAGCMDSERYEFINFGVKDIVDDLNSFIRQLRTVNPGARVILTVSPVPLIATYEDRHVLVSTTYSKSALRVAAEEVASHHHDVAYFPSYEVITGAFNRGAYFEADLRSIRSDGVEHVMALFLRHYTNTVTAIRKPQSSSIGAWMEAEEAQKVVCDEILMDT